MTAWATDPDSTAASYERVSKRVQALYGYGFHRQARSVDEMAASLNVVLPDDLRFRDGVDDDANGSRDDLPELDRVMDLARRGRYKTLLVASTDRWTRDTPKGMAFTRQVRTYGVRVVWGDLPEVPDSGDGNPYEAHWRQKMETEAFQDAEFEKARIRWRTMNGRRDKAASGMVVGAGSSPYGYRYVRDDTPKHRVCDLEPYEPEAAIIRELYERALTMSLGELLDWLNAVGTPPPGARRTYRKPRYKASAGQKWSSHTLYNILTNRLYIGEYTYRKSTRRVTPIVTDDKFDQVRAALEERQGRRGPARRGTVDDEFLFRNRLVCGPCSEATGRRVVLHSHRANKQGERYYLCPHRWEKHTRSIVQIGLRCTLPSINAALLEEQVWRAIIDACLDPERLRAELADARTRRRQSGQVREDREAAIKGSMAHQERILVSHVRRIVELEAEGTEEADIELPVHHAGRDEARSLLVRLKRELLEVQALPGPGLSQSESEAIEQLAAVVTTAAEYATPAERRQAIALLNLRATLGKGDDEVVVQAARPRRTMPISWTGAIEVRTRQQAGDSDVSFLKFALQMLPSSLVFAA